MKRFVIAAVSAVILSVSCHGAVAASSQEGQPLKETLSQTGRQFRDQVKTIMAEYKGLAQANAALKAAGTSYQSALTAPTEHLSHYATPAQRAVMAGVYTFDAGYAALFLKKKQMGRALQVRKAMYEKIGFALPLSARMKALIQNPDSITNFSAWTQAIDEMADRAIATGMTSDRHLAVLVNTVYGMVVEGLYIVTESVALAGYPPKMLAVMDTQHRRVQFLLKLMIVFKNDPTFSHALGLKARMNFMGEIQHLLNTPQLNRDQVDGLRHLITPERTAMLKGTLRGFTQN